MVYCKSNFFVKYIKFNVNFRVMFYSLCILQVTLVSCFILCIFYRSIFRQILFLLYFKGHFGDKFYFLYFLQVILETYFIPCILNMSFWRQILFLVYIPGHVGDTFYFLYIFQVMLETYFIPCIFCRSFCPLWSQFDLKHKLLELFLRVSTWSLTF